MRQEKDILISQFIDDELSLDEKIEFVNEVHSNADFTQNTVSLLEQEIELTDMSFTPPPLPEFEVKEERKVRRLLPVINLAASLTAVAAVLIVTVKVFLMPAPQTTAQTDTHRFVLHMPQASSVELAGSFTGWNRIGMKKISDSGYWQINIPLEKGEYAYIFIVDGKTQIADPTVKAKQVDDFGGENSIINIGNEI